MRLSDYLASRGETYTEFGRRCRPPVPSNTIGRIAQEGNPQLRIGYRIVQASREQPAPDGGTVTLDDLLADGSRDATDSESAA